MRTAHALAQYKKVAKGKNISAVAALRPSIHFNTFDSNAKKTQKAKINYVLSHSLNNCGQSYLLLLELRLASFASSSLLFFSNFASRSRRFFSSFIIFST
eukprot:scpid79596/ scgid13598/ 